MALTDATEGKQANHPGDDGLSQTQNSVSPQNASPIQSASTLGRLYRRVVLTRPVLVLIVLLLAMGCTLRFAPQFAFDASADSLTLEDDKDVAYYRESRHSFPTNDDFLIIALTPRDPLFSEAVISKLLMLKHDLLRLSHVRTVNSVLDVPVLNAPELTLTNVSEHLETLESGYNDWAAAQEAFTENPFYRDLLVSRDGRTTAMQIVLNTNPRSAVALTLRNDLRAKARESTLSAEEAQTLQQLELEVKTLNEQAIAAHAEAVKHIRAVMHNYSDLGTLFLGGIPMIVVDMLDYVRNDVGIFGVGVVAFLVLMLSILFRRPLWVILPLVCSAVTCAVMVGFLGYLRFPVTVISSNFISLLLIITMSMIIHLVVRYRELEVRYPGWTQQDLVAETVAQMALPCLYTSLTTVVAFVSLLVSNIRPVIDFGIMMTMGIGFAYLTAFLLFPVILVLRRRAANAANAQQLTEGFSIHFAQLTRRWGRGLIAIALVLAAFSVWGISQLSVENRFIDYFKEKTEIYQGMKTIDERLGGTTPLDIILDVKLADSSSNAETDCFVDDDCLEDVYEEGTVFTQARLAQFRDIQMWLESLPETGKVLSVVTTISLAERIKGAPLNALELAFLNAMFPDDLRGLLLDPYVNETRGQVRFSLRVIESDASLKRQALLDKIQHYLIQEQNLDPADVHFTGMVVLYNNMLQSLFRSQIATIGVVFACIMVMFLVLFRSFYLAVIGIIPNILAASVVLGMMGVFHIPLDMMTITIAAISVGIAVDNTIHYIYRFKAEFARDKDYERAMFRSHGTIGRAMYYTSITIIFGFSILALSSFYPTIYFGLFTGLAMFIALLASLTLLPELIVLFKPLGPSQNAQASPSGVSAS